MTPDSIIDVFSRGIYIAIILVSFLVIPGLIVGLMIAMFQAATQINEISLTFVPKIIITFLALLIFGAYLVDLLVNYTQTLFLDIPSMIG